MRRTVLDTNVLVSALANPSGVPGQIYNLWVESKFEFICSDYIIWEFTRISTGKVGFDINDVLPIVGRIYRFAIMIQPVVIMENLVPRNDLPILGTAVAGYAETIVTGDKELLELGVYQDIRIITPRKFLQIL